MRITPFRSALRRLRNINIRSIGSEFLPSSYQIDGMRQIKIGLAVKASPIQIRLIMKSNSTLGYLFAYQYTLV